MLVPITFLISRCTVLRLLTSTHRPPIHRRFAFRTMANIRPIDGTNSPWKSFKPDELSGRARYGMCISSVVPRPVAVITSVSSNADDADTAGGIVNCAPFSYTSLLTHDPPIVAHGICLANGRKKDSLVNIEATGEWVYNVLTTGYTEETNACSASLPADVDETEATGLETLPCEMVSPPRLEKATVAMECKLWDKKEVFNDKGEHTTTIVMGRIVNFHVHESVLKDGQAEDDPRVDLKKLQAVGRAGDITFWPHGVIDDNMLSAARPK